MLLTVEHAKVHAFSKASVTMNKVQEEKREAPRIEVKLMVDLKTTYIYSTASVLNISRTGLFIKTPNPLPEGSEIEIGIYFGNDKKAQIFKAIVRWQRSKSMGMVPAGMGVKLLEPDMDLLDTLAKDIQRLPKNI